jgi:hypothetical protein
MILSVLYLVPDLSHIPGSNVDVIYLILLPPRINSCKMVNYKWPGETTNTS